MTTDLPHASLDGAIPPEVLELCERLHASGHRAWIVGGCLRDKLLGRAVSDWDLATSAVPREVQQVFRHVIPTGIDHGTVTVLWKDRPYEVTTLRGEGAYSDGRRPDSVEFVRSIEEDLARRDFTINAVAYEPLGKTLTDPYGGIDDMKRRCIRAVGEAIERFREDGLRVLRGARFVATLEFDLDPATEAAIAPTLDIFRKVSRERVREEWMKTMKAARPSLAFEVMRRTGILEASCPEMLEQVGCEQNKFHAYDVWTHTMHVLDACEPDPVLRMAALLHDIGKPRSREKSEKTGDYTFYNHERIGAKMAARWLEDYRFSRAEIDRIVALVRHHLVCYASEWTDAAVRRFLQRVSTELVDDLIRLARADARGKGRPVESELGLLDELAARIERVLAEGSALSTRDLAISGTDVMQHLGWPPGPRVGEVLRALLERVLDDPGLNTQQNLVAMLPEIAAGLGAER